ncbi:MAG: hypothetical protein ACM31O_18645 [Bacteroidota bacterium]
MHTADAAQADAHLDPGRFPRERFRSRGAGMTPGESLGECISDMGCAIDVDYQRLKRDELAFRWNTRSARGVADFERANRILNGAAQYQRIYSLRSPWRFCSLSVGAEPFPCVAWAFVLSMRRRISSPR